MSDRYELHNIFITCERLGRTTDAHTQQAHALIARLPIELDDAAQNESLLALARRHALSIYDAAYLELALRTGAPLATLDAELAQAARLAGVTLIGAPER